MGLLHDRNPDVLVDPTTALQTSIQSVAGSLKVSWLAMDSKQAFNGTSFKKKTWKPVVWVNLRLWRHHA
jgi:hypothetical protein